MPRCNLLYPFLAFLIAATGTTAGCKKPESVPPWFADVTDELRLDFVHDAGPTGKYFMPQVMGSGCALIDFDGDGRLDIYLLTNGGPGAPSTNKLYRQTRDGTFAPSPNSGLDIPGFNMGVAVGDVDNDGWPDVVVTQYGGIRLFLNNGNGTFRDASKDSGLDNPNWGTSACFVDYDKDGWLDLVVTNYVDYDPSLRCGDSGGKHDFCHPNQFRGSVTRLFRNLGSAGAKSGGKRFQDVTMKSGLGRLPGPGLGVVCADFNGDGWPDIFVANDAQPNRLWINQHDGTFKDEGIERGLGYNGMAQVQANMGVALGDVDGDGRLDLFVTHLTEETHTLWRQEKGGRPGFFRDRTLPACLAATSWRGTGFGTVLVDFDHDGALDIAVVNGRVMRGEAVNAPGLPKFWHAYAELNQLFANDGTGAFRDRSQAETAFCGRPGVARGLAWGDIDGDGAIDLLVTNVAGPARLYRNVAPHKGHWLIVRAFDPRLRRDAYGALVTLQAGSRRWVGLVNPGSSYLSSSDARVHFGLGSARRVDSIQVEWPDGKCETFTGGDADRAIQLDRGKGKPARIKGPKNVG